jgi:MFS family permease
MLVDRGRRMPLLAFSIVLWSLASLVGALSGSYSTLLLTRLALGAVAATAGPAIASLTGDYFPAGERGRIYAYILGGEIAGSAVGYIISGSVASLIDWRAAFVILALPGFFLAAELWRTVPEPRRGGQSYLEPGAETLEATVEEGPELWPGVDDVWPETDPRDEIAQAAARRAGATPNPRLVLDEDPRRMGIVSSVKYILSIPSNLLMILGSSLGYFYFSGLQTFALLFVRGHYHASQATAEVVLAALVGGALIGTLISGKLTDVMLHRGMLAARVWVPAVCYVGAAALLVPGFVSTTLTPALWFDVGGAALLSAANPPIQAARLDIMPAGLWGRAESTRTFVRSLAQAIAPTLFGGVADLIAGFVPHQAPIGTHPHAPTSAQATGLEITFLIMLVTLVASGLIVARARTTYASDVATAAASWPAGQSTPLAS